MRQLAAGQTWLTEFDQSFDEPAAQVRTDFTFAPAAHDTPVVTYNYPDDYFIPGDVAALLGILVSAIVGGVTIVLRRRQRSS